MRGCLVASMTRAGRRAGRVPSPARLRLMERGIPVRAVAEHADVHETWAGRVLRGGEPIDTDAAARVVRAAELLSGLTWAELTKPWRRVAA